MKVAEGRRKRKNASQNFCIFNNKEHASTNGQPIEKTENEEGEEESEQNWIAIV